LDGCSDGRLGLDPLSPLPFDDHRCFVPAHPVATSQTVSLRGRQTAIGPDAALLDPRDASGEAGIASWPGASSRATTVERSRRPHR
jgi:hypothetical protein